jgi:hypothetical protein
MMLSAIVTVCFALEGKQPHCLISALRSAKFDTVTDCELEIKNAAVLLEANVKEQDATLLTFSKGECLGTKQFAQRIKDIPAFTDSLGATYSLRFY